MSGISLTASFFYCHPEDQSLRELVHSGSTDRCEIAKRKRSTARGLRDEEAPLAEVPSSFQHLRGLIRPVGFKLRLRFVFTNYRLQGLSPLLVMLQLDPSIQPAERKSAGMRFF